MKNTLYLLGFLRITNPKFPRFLRKFFIEIIEIKFFSAPPRLRGATGFSGFSPCLSASVVGLGLVVALLRRASVVGFWLWLCYVVSFVFLRG